MKKYYMFVMFAVILLVLGLTVYLSVDRGDELENTATGSNSEPNAAVPVIVSASANIETVSRFEKFELTIDLQADYENPYDPEQVDLNAELESPSGKMWRINGYYDGSAWKLRFSPDEAGKWRYHLFVTDKNGKAEGPTGEFEAAASERHGWVEVSQANPRFLAHRDGTPFYGVGIAYPWGVSETGLDLIAMNGGNLITYWNGNYDNSGAGGGDDQLESLNSGIGKYDMLKGMRIDELVEQFEARDLYMNFVIWPHDSLADNINWPATWDKNAYSTLGEAKDFYSDKEMWKYQEKLYRYIIARWGHSRAIGMWNLITEINGTDGWQLGDPKKANEWVTKVHNYFKENDPYGHPTVGSMAGGASDYWEHGYKTLDIADRENYYDLHFSAYAADIQKRWNDYEKPLLIGESGNVTDVNAYHDALWASLANGLAASPIWWDMGKVNGDMFAQMKHFGSFVKGLDVLEPREPVELSTASVEQTLDAEVALASVGGWSQPDWADANKDANGKVYNVQEQEDAVSTQMLFRTGEYAQGVVQQTIDAAKDWSSYSTFSFEVYIEHEGKGQIKARPVMFPNGQWVEGDDKSDVVLVSGEWVLLSVPLLEPPSRYWRDHQVSANDLANIVQWGVKLYTGKSREDAKPTVVKVRNARLTAEQAPVVTIKESQGWMMRGEQSSYGWMVTEAGGAITGITAEASGLTDGSVRISWYDPWEGKAVGETEASVNDGKLRLTAPALNRPDIAFIITTTKE